MNMYALRPFYLLNLISVGLLSFALYSPVQADDPPVYTPPVDGKPDVTVGGGTRGYESVEDSEFLSVLATQNHTGHTISSQPTLYWAILKDLQNPIMISLSNLDAAMQNGEPLLDVQIANPKAGIYHVDLAQHNVSLQAGVEYAWGIEALVDEHFPSRNPSSMATLKCVKPELSVSEALAKTDELEHPSIYAKAGLWYDAIDSLSRLMEKYPDKSAVLRQHRNVLLQQIGLQRIAKYERMIAQSDQ